MTDCPALLVARINSQNRIYRVDWVSTVSYFYICIYPLCNLIDSCVKFIGVAIINSYVIYPINNFRIYEFAQIIEHQFLSCL